jgi:hypothetical protein
MDTNSGNSMTQTPFTLFSDNRLHKIQWIKISKSSKTELECKAEFNEQNIGTDSFRN